MNQLTKQSSEAEIKAYFCAVLNLSKSDEEFPVNLDEVWPLVYSAKEKAVRALKSNDLFMQGIDYQVLAQNGENPEGGRPTNIYMLSVPCLEFFIARKVRPVFESTAKYFIRWQQSSCPRRSPLLRAILWQRLSRWHAILTLLATDGSGSYR